MTAFSIFDDYTIEDMNQHLFAIAAKPQHGSLPGVGVSSNLLRMKIIVDEVRALERREYWLPGERVAGTLSIESKDPITLARTRIRLDGKTTSTTSSQLPRAASD